MTTATQHAAPEEIMTWLDGELAAAEAGTIGEHVQACAECTDVAEQFRETSRAIAAWKLQEPSEKLDSVIREKSVRLASRPSSKPLRYTRLSVGNWRLWAVGGSGALAGVVLLVIVLASQTHTAEYFVAPERLAQTSGLAGPVQVDALLQPAPRNYAALQQINGGLAGKTASTAAPPNPSAPMIARTVSLIIQVKDVTGSRQALDAILTRYQGYAAELTMNTPEGSARSFSASLRIPAPALSAALADLRSLGRVQNESQSGEEVTQQHADLVARLKNARETEQRLQAILQQRTGKVEEVLQVEEQISNTRGEIERMEAEQKALEHRVDFATVQLQLAEEYKAQLNGPSTSIGTRMHNAIVSGLGNAGSSLLGILLFFEEFGPVLLVWLVVLGTPAWFLWRRYRKAQSGI